MARNSDIIHNNMLINKALEPDLSPLSNTSIVSVWRNILKVTSISIAELEVLFDQLKIDVSELIKQGIPGTEPWIQFQVLQFQKDDELVYENGRWVYPIINIEKRIIKRCSVKTITDFVAIKVAKEDSNGNPLALTVDEKLKLDNYLSRYIMFAGVPYLLSSYDTDIFKVDIELFYDGLYDLVSLQDTVNNTINNFAKNIPFDAILHITDFILALRNIEGITDIVVNSFEAKESTGSYSAVDRIYELKSGFIEFNSDDSTITYTAENY